MTRFVLWLLGWQEPRNAVDREKVALSAWADRMATVKEEARQIVEAEQRRVDQEAKP